ncbi:hypothetical protein [Planctomyces sp. SH-PL14]|uniref:hypothetical protein n=1 Tax=Planctomyces sp. SH-PL14 TaxID=1632864 RepID=UPI00078BEA7A|nr:hypothetical protein [Planctomyces sp. SH-PL14]AMV16587.1 hypothetical protein VT03_01775 [Planctomyces sp. SH-PL14]
MSAQTSDLESLNSLLSSLSTEEVSLLLRRSSSPEPTSEAESDRQRKKRKRAEERALSIPPVQDPERRLRLEREGCAAWLAWYRNDLFYHDFTPNQRRIIQSIDERIQFGGLKAIAAPRGDGKTAICEGTMQFALVRGRLRYPLIVAANAEAASDIMDNIKTPFEVNERLIADYPEICIPVQELAEAPQLAAGQTVNGRKTLGEWSKKGVRFPTVWLDWCPNCLSAETLGELHGPFLCLRCGHAFELWKSDISGLVFGPSACSGRSAESGRRPSGRTSPCSTTSRTRNPRSAGRR